MRLLRDNNSLFAARAMIHVSIFSLKSLKDSRRVCDHYNLTLMFDFIFFQRIILSSRAIMALSYARRSAPRGRKKGGFLEEKNSHFRFLFGSRIW